MDVGVLQLGSLTSTFHDCLDLDPNMLERTRLPRSVNLSNQGPPQNAEAQIPKTDQSTVVATPQAQDVGPLLEAGRRPRCA